MKRSNLGSFYRAVLLGEVPAVSEARLSWPLTPSVNRCGSTPPTPLISALLRSLSNAYVGKYHLLQRFSSDSVAQAYQKYKKHFKCI